jgi:hypothetical protein
MSNKPTASDLEEAGVETQLFLKPVRLQGEPKSDRAFEVPSGRKYRTRIVKTDNRVERSPNESLGSDNIIPTDFTLTLTVAELDENNKVAKSGDRFSIFGAHEVPITQHQMAQPHFDLASILEIALDTKIREVEQIITNRKKMLEQAAELGIEL